MGRYMWQVRYTAEGARGLLAQGGTVRKAAITQMVESVGGRVESVYYAFGPDDLIVIGEVPNEVAAAAMAIRTAASGFAVSRTTELLTPEQIDAATQLDVEYTPPAGS
ncbi:MAG: GYD domain-containing protein [Nocardiaceae bacterium]|nr:GYD domain-containing protein [Nocardiaceae bacterium]